MTQLALFSARKQPSLRVPARALDPEPSHRAAALMERSGRADSHAAQVLAIVRARPGLTYREIGETLGGGQWIVEAQRRLQGLLKAKLVRKGDRPRECSTNGNLMATWYPAQIGN